MKKYLFLIILLSITFCVKNHYEITDADNEMGKTEELYNIDLMDVDENEVFKECSTGIHDWEKNKKGEYQYPVNCDDKRWKELSCHKEMMKACNVPEKILNKLSTEQLLELVLDYPLLCDIYAYNDVEVGIYTMATRFNAFSELLCRDDCSKMVLSRYLKTEIVEKNENNKKTFENITENVVLEDILAQKEVLEDLSEREKNKLVKCVEQKTEEKTQSDVYSENDRTFYDVIDKNGMNRKIKLKKIPKVVDDKVEASAANASVKTPNGTKVAVTKEKYKGKEWSDVLTFTYVKAYPNAKKLGKADNRYNCHSYAWYKARTDNKYWMNNPKAYVSDGSYKYVGKVAKAKGQKAVYKYQVVPYDTWIHSAIAVNKKGKLKSKWGMAPLMEHNESYSPYAGSYTVIHYYKKN